MLFGFNHVQVLISRFGLAVNLANQRYTFPKSVFSHSILVSYYNGFLWVWWFVVFLLYRVGHRLRSRSSSPCWGRIHFVWIRKQFFQSAPSHLSRLPHSAASPSRTSHESPMPIFLKILITFLLLDLCLTPFWSGIMCLERAEGRFEGVIC